MQTLNHTNKAAIRDFVNHAGFDVQVRTVELTNELRHLGARELRTKKNDNLAECWDSLGNVTILTAKRQVLNLTGAEYKAR
jgi:hypothetical protein